MIPLYDRNRPRRAPVVTLALIAINVAVFVYEVKLSLVEGEDAVEAFIDRHGLKPGYVAGLLSGKDEIIVKYQRRTPWGIEPVAQERIPLTVVSCLLPLLTCMFVHAGWGHIIGNMWFLWIFGDNVEDRLGHVRYLLFYIVAGVLASIVHIVVTLLFSGDTLVPTIGASGAVSAVLGAYVIAFPRARIVTLVPIFIIPMLFEIPAALFLFFWFFFLQLIPGLGGLGSSQGVAFWAHIGGFVTGFAYLWHIKHRPPRPPGRYVSFRHVS